MEVLNEIDIIEDTNLIIFINKCNELIKNGYYPIYPMNVVVKGDSTAVYIQQWQKLPTCPIDNK